MMQPDTNTKTMIVPLRYFCPYCPYGWPTVLLLTVLDEYR